MIWVAFAFVIWATWVSARWRGRRDIASGKWEGYYRSTGARTVNNEPVMRWIFERVNE